jgi:(+)-neomenthol dehydrogenase
VCLLGRIAVVTGGNKGIGLEVCQQLARNGVVVILTARDETRGAAAVEKLRGLGLCDVIFQQLEVTDTESVAQLADFLKTSFGKLDILVIIKLAEKLELSWFDYTVLCMTGN